MTSELAVVAELCSSLEAALFKERLEANGIACYLDNAQVADMFGQIDALGGVRILVAAADRVRAERIIEAARLQAERAGQAAEPVASKAPPHHWTCLLCGEVVANQFMVCWSCGASREGIPDPTFRRADELPAENPESPREGATRDGLRLTVAIVLLILGTLVFLADATGGNSTWINIVFWLGLWGLAALLWPRK